MLQTYVGDVFMTLDPANTTERIDATRERLLNAAERLFAAKGFAGTSVREITSAAGTNIASVNYHFGGKQNLYREVFHRRLASLRELRTSRLSEALQTAGDGATLELVVSTFTAAFLEPLIHDSEGRLFIELMAREMLSPHLPREVFFEEMIDPVQKSLAVALRRVEPRLDDSSARNCVHSIVGQLTHVIHLSRLRLGVDSELWPTAELQRIADHIIRFSVGGVRAAVPRMDS